MEFRKFHNASGWLKVTFLILIGYVLILQFEPYTLQRLRQREPLPWFTNRSFTGVFYDRIAGNETLKHSISNALAQIMIASQKIRLCQASTDLGPYTVDTRVRDLNETLKFHPDVLPGGSWTPPDCRSRDNVAILIPYRNRSDNLRIFLFAMHGFLQEQNLKYTIFVIEQADKKLFNRGKLLNVGFVEALKLDPTYSCFIFHDVDKIPDNLRNEYDCRGAPKAMMINHRWQGATKYIGPFYSTYFGGVTGLTTQQFKKINGFSNAFWGWGGEDDDFYMRVKNHGISIQHLEGEIGSYTVLSHHNDMHMNKDLKLLMSSESIRHRLGRDGLSDLKYSLISLIRYPLYTGITVNT